MCRIVKRNDFLTKGTYGFQTSNYPLFIPVRLSKEHDFLSGGSVQQVTVLVPSLVHSVFQFGLRKRRPKRDAVFNEMPFFLFFGGHLSSHFLKRWQTDHFHSVHKECNHFFRSIVVLFFETERVSVEASVKPVHCPRRIFRRNTKFDVF